MSWAAVAAGALLLVPVFAHAQGRQNQQNVKNGSGNTQSLNLAPNPMESPVKPNPEDLLPVLALGPLPRSNNSPAILFQFTNQQISQLIVQLTNPFINMSENMSGGNGPPGATCGNGSSVNCNNQRGKNSRGLAGHNPNSQQNQQGTGEHANPGQGQGQTP